MLNELSHKLSRLLIMNGADNGLEEEYAYGIECTLSTAIILLLLAIGGIVMGKFPHVLVFTAAWLPLRILVGGSSPKRVLWTIERGRRPMSKGGFEL